MLVTAEWRDLPGLIQKDYWPNGDISPGPNGLDTTSTGFAVHYASLIPVKGQSDVELLAKVKIDTLVAKQGLLVIRGNVFFDRQQNRNRDSGYIVAYQQGVDGLTYLKVDYADGTFSQAVAVANPLEWNWVRFSVKGSEIKAKVWGDGQVEPGWQIVINDTYWPADSNGSVGIAHFSGGTVTYNYISASTDSRPAPKPGDYVDTYVNAKPEPELGYWGAPGLRPLGLLSVPKLSVNRYNLTGNRTFEHLTISKPKLTYAPPRYTLSPNRAAERLTITSPTLLGNGPKYNLKGRRGWVHLVFKTKPTLTYTPPKPGELRPVQAVERLTIKPPALSYTSPIYALRASRITERVNISSPTLTAHTAALIQPEGLKLRVGISSPNVIFIPKPEVLTLKPAPITLRLTITRTNNLLDPSVYNIQYKQYKPDYVGIKAYEGETLNIDRYRPDTIETGKIDSIELNTNRYKQIVIK
jgi:hypothetical protein|nr:MAG TPA: hypothetical protein [Caudoviricetes sp.]